MGLLNFFKSEPLEQVHARRSKAALYHAYNLINEINDTTPTQPRHYELITQFYHLASTSQYVYSNPELRALAAGFWMRRWVLPTLQATAA